METWDLYNYKKEKINKIVYRGEKLEDNEYHIVVNAWIKNKRGEYLITRRSKNKSHPLMWECTGGSAISGETSLDAVCREVKEELGISVNKEKATFIGTKLRYYPGCPDILDVWLLEDETPIEQIMIQEEEVCDVMWATSEKIMKLKANGEFEANAFFEEILGIENQESVYYIGFNANNAICNECFFKGSITLYPTKEKGNRYYSDKLVYDTKSSAFMQKYKKYVFNTAKSIQECDKNAKFLCFNAKIKKLCSDMEDINILKNEEGEIDTLLNDKFKTRELLKDIVPMLDYKWADSENLDYDNLKNEVNKESFVLQAASGSGGSNTFLITSQNDIEKYVTERNVKYCVSSYISHIPINITMIIGEFNIISLPVSVQLIMLTDNKFKYVGGDYIYSQKLDKNVLSDVENYSLKIAELIQKKGYRGILGIDYIINEQNKVLFMEINPRFQASSFLLSQYLEKYCNTNIAKLHYNAITRRKVENPNLRVVDSCFLNCNEIQQFNNFKNYTIIDKGYFPENISSIYRKVFDYSIYHLENFEKIGENNVLNMLT